MTDQLHILNLPTNSLVKILEHVPDRWSAAQVCVEFYGLVAFIEHSKYRMGVTFSKNADQVWITREFHEIFY